MPNNKNRSRRQLQLIAEALAAGRNVVVDNTNPTALDRQPIIELGHVYRASSVTTSPRIEECLQRNRAREVANRVPDVALYTTVKRLERPKLTEGFDALYYIHLLSATAAA